MESVVESTDESTFSTVFDGGHLRSLFTEDKTLAVLKTPEGMDKHTGGGCRG